VVLENKVCYHNYTTPANERVPAPGIAHLSLGGVVKVFTGFGMKKEHPPTPDIQLKSAVCDWDFALFSINP
jgi:hypothetical protein